MGKSFGFCDLCINPENHDKNRLRELLKKLLEMGYSTVAINQTVEETIFETDKKNKKKNSENDAPGFALPSPVDIRELVAEFEGKLRILSRLTFVYADPTRTHTMNQSSNLRKYDLYAVVPKTQAAFQFACSQLSTDLISVNRNCTGIKLSRKLYLQAAERGIHFEIQYCDVVDTAKRKFAIYYAHLFHMFGKSKNVILTSGASMPNQIRSPYDIVNLASILGLNETKAKASILSQSRYLILKAEGRRYGKAVFQIQSSVVKNKQGETEVETEDNEDSDAGVDRKKLKI